MRKTRRVLESLRRRMAAGEVAGGEAGQASVEFALVLIMLMSFVLFYIQLSFIFAFGNYAHYATFMAARALQSSGADDEDQATRAKDVIVRMLKRSEGQGTDKFPFIAKSVGGGAVGGTEIGPHSQFSAESAELSWLMGVRYTFKSRLFIIPMGKNSDRSARGGDPNSVTLTTESWLGREPSDVTCFQQLKERVGRALYDNGC